MNRFKREDGVEHDDERRLGFGVFLDHILPIIAVALLAWLCLGQITLQQQVAVLIERTTAQNAQVVALHNMDNDLQRQIDILKDGRR